MMLQQYADKSLQRTEHCAMQKYRRVFLSVFADISCAKTCRQVQVDLVRATLPVTANGIA